MQYNDVNNENGGDSNRGNISGYYDDDDDDDHYDDVCILNSDREVIVMIWYLDGDVGYCDNKYDSEIFFWW